MIKEKYFKPSDRNKNRKKTKITFIDEGKISKVKDSLFKPKHMKCLEDVKGKRYLQPNVKGQRPWIICLDEKKSISVGQDTSSDEDTETKKAEPWINETLTSPSDQNHSDPDKTENGEAVEMEMENSISGVGGGKRKADQEDRSDDRPHKRRRESQSHSQSRSNSVREAHRYFNHQWTLSPILFFYILLSAFIISSFHCPMIFLNAILVLVETTAKGTAGERALLRVRPQTISERSGSTCCTTLWTRRGGTRK